MSRHKPLESAGLSDRTRIPAFRRTVLGWYRKHSRPMPWREDCSPYAVFVSEVMLQQTQVERVIPKFSAFIARLPGFRELAAANLGDVYALWQGLGYNRRAKWLRDAAVQIMERHGGELPDTIEDITALPGIGKNTAGAICAYAFNAPAVYIETNIRTVFIRHFFPGRDDVADSEILPLVERTLDRKNPRVWYWALMDYGTMLKKTEGNHSRKSRAHRAQSPFAASDRRIRGLLLKRIGEQKSSPKRELLNLGEPRRVERLLADLEREGLVREEHGVYRIGD